MNKRRISFINEANKRVNLSLRHINRVGELGVKYRPHYTESDVVKIISELYCAVERAGSRFKRDLPSEEKSFRLSRTDSLTKTGAKRTAPWVEIFESLDVRRDAENQKLRRMRSKPIATDKAADYLLQGIAKVLLLPGMPAGAEAADWVLSNPKSVIILDAKKSAQTFKPTLEKAPQSMIKGRLKTIRAFAPETSVVRAMRAPLGIRLPKSIDRRYAVVLFRQS